MRVFAIMAALATAGCAPAYVAGKTVGTGVKATKAVAKTATRVVF